MTLSNDDLNFLVRCVVRRRQFREKQHRRMERRLGQSEEAFNDIRAQSAHGIAYMRDLERRLEEMKT